MNAIAVAYRGRIDMFTAVGWIEKPEEPVPADKAPSAVSWLVQTFGNRD